MFQFESLFIVVAQQGASGMSLITWLPALFLLGLTTFGLLFAFVKVCDRV